MKKNTIFELKDFLILWSTQSFSQLGSAMTAYALTLWLYDKTGSALSTAALTICSYAPYVLMSVFASALTDRLNKKKVMLACDSLAALCTLAVFALHRTGRLAVGHLYLLTAVSGLMNTVQQPASDVAMTLIVPKARYQQASGLRSLSRSLITILNPPLAAALYSFGRLELVIAADLGSFAAAFLALLPIRLPRQAAPKKERLWTLARDGLSFLRRNPLLLTLILFMAGVNLMASIFDAALPAYVLSNPRGGARVYGLVASCSGIAMVFGSLLAALLPAPKDRVRAIYLTALVSLGAENLLLAFARAPWLWCAAQLIGWLPVPVMDANLDVILRASIPVDLQGRVYACRNALQFFTIPVGLFLGGAAVDRVFEPLMAACPDASPLHILFGGGKGSGAAMLLGLLGATSVLLCLAAGRRLKKYRYHKQAPLP